MNCNRCLERLDDGDHIEYGLCADCYENFSKQDLEDQLVEIMEQML